jgi:hypothetical protein
MSARVSVLLGLLCLAGLAACGDQQSPNSAPTEPRFVNAAKPGGSCDFQAIQQAVNAEFTGQTDVAVSKLVTSMKNYQGAGDVSNATYVGYQVLDSLAHAGRQQGTPAAGSTLAIALLHCMEIGGATIPSSFTGPLGDTTGAFGVRGLAPADAEGLLSHDGIWEIVPQAGQTWQGITTTGAAVVDTVAHIILVYGDTSSLSQPQFTNDTPLSSVYDWATVPIATFSPGVVVGQCSGDLGYIQHNPASSGGEVLGFVPISCTGATALLMESTPRTLAERIGRFFSPEPAFAAVLLSGSGGTKGSLSPFGKIDPGAVNLVYLSTPNKSGQTINAAFNPIVSAVIKSDGGTQFKQGQVFAWLEATSNNGSFVQVCNNWAFSDATGTFSFPLAYVNKAGGYTITVKTVGTDVSNGGSSAGGTPQLPPGQQPTTPLFNVKNASTTSGTGCDKPNAFTAGDPIPTASAPSGTFTQ